MEERRRVDASLQRKNEKGCLHGVAVPFSHRREDAIGGVAGTRQGRERGTGAPFDLSRPFYFHPVLQTRSILVQQAFIKHL